MPQMVEVTCACGCGRRKMVRVADRKRGWGRFFSKSCKARWQERRTGQHQAFLQRVADAGCEVDGPYGLDYLLDSGDR